MRDMKWICDCLLASDGTVGRGGAGAVEARRNLASLARLGGLFSMATYRVLRVTRILFYEIDIKC